MSDGGGIPTDATMLSDKLLAAPAASFDFPAIVQNGFRDLRLRLKLRTDQVAVNDIAFFAANGDAVDANYDLEYARANNAAMTANPIAAAAFSRICGFPVSSTGTATHFGEITIDVYDYLDAATKVIGWQSRCFATRAVANFFLDSGMIEWANVAAINRITITPFVGPNFVVGSRATLYGIP